MTAVTGDNTVTARAQYDEKLPTFWAIFGLLCIFLGGGGGVFFVLRKMFMIKYPALASSATLAPLVVLPPPLGGRPIIKLILSSIIILQILLQNKNKLTGNSDACHSHSIVWQFFCIDEEGDREGEGSECQK